MDALGQHVLHLQVRDIFREVLEEEREDRIRRNPRLRRNDLHAVSVQGLLSRGLTLDDLNEAWRQGTIRLFPGRNNELETGGALLPKGATDDWPPVVQA